jgi:transposase
VIVFDSRSGRTASLLNPPAALADWAARIEPGSLVVCEAPGGYEAALLAAVSAAGLSVHQADARKVKAFIRSFGTLGKTDAIDARALAGYGA